MCVRQTDRLAATNFAASEVSIASRYYTHNNAIFCSMSRIFHYYVRLLIDEIELSALPLLDSFIIPAAAAEV